MADNLNSGVATLTVDGRAIPVVKALTYRVSGVVRETQTGQDDVHGKKIKPLAGMISATIRDSSGLSLGDVNDWDDVTVVAELANGKVIVGRNMWTVDNQEVNTEEGEFELKFEGLDVSEN